MKLANSILRLGLFILFAVFFTKGGIAQDNKPASPAEQEIISAARDRANALTNRKCDKWASFVAVDFQDIEALGTESRDVYFSTVVARTLWQPPNANPTARFLTFISSSPETSPSYTTSMESPNTAAT